MKKTALLIFLLLSFALPAQEADLSGKVVAISDGDALTVLCNKEKIKVRLYGIDCPEMDQPFGTKARQFTSDLALGKVVTIHVKDIDSNDLTVGEVILPDRKVLNYELVNAGLAWHYVKDAPKEETLEALEKEARKAKRGLWADPNPIPPWEWRRGNRGELEKSEDKKEGE